MGARRTRASLRMLSPGSDCGLGQRCTQRPAEGQGGRVFPSRPYGKVPGAERSPGEEVGTTKGGRSGPSPGPAPPATTARPHRFNGHSPCGRQDFPGGSAGQESAPQCEGPGFDPWAGKIPWRRAWTHSSVLAWRIPQTEEPGGLRSVGAAECPTQLSDSAQHT